MPSIVSSSSTNGFRQSPSLPHFSSCCLCCVQLSRLVAENIFSFDAKFWMRIATRNDSLKSDADKEKLKGVADTVMLLVDAMVKQTEQQLNDSAAVLQVRHAGRDAGYWPVRRMHSEWPLQGAWLLHQHQVARRLP
jgi:hypothetical protein